MAKSKVMKESRERELKAMSNLSPADKLQIACELSDLCRELSKAGKRARRGAGRKS